MHKVISKATNILNYKICIKSYCKLKEKKTFKYGRKGIKEKVHRKKLSEKNL